MRILLTTGVLPLKSVHPIDRIKPWRNVKNMVIVTIFVDFWLRYLLYLISVISQGRYGDIFIEFSARLPLFVFVYVCTSPYNIHLFVEPVVIVGVAYVLFTHAVGTRRPSIKTPEQRLKLSGEEPYDSQGRLDMMTDSDKPSQKTIQTQEEILAQRGVFFFRKSFAPERSQEAPTISPVPFEQSQPHSRQGIVSFVIALFIFFQVLLPNSFYPYRTQRPLFGLLLSFVGIGFGRRGLNQRNKKSGLAIVGIVLNIVWLLASLFYCAIAVLVSLMRN